MSREAITASLEDFARTGRLGPLSLGLRRQDVLETLGAPTDFMVGESVEQSDIWKYGDVEVHFSDDLVWLVHFDRFEVPAGGPTLKLEPWVVRRGLPLQDLEQALRRSSIGFSVARDSLNPECMKAVTSAGVEFVVQVEGEASELGLSIFGRPSVWGGAGMETLREALADWSDWDGASNALGKCVGLMPPGPGWHGAKHVFWSNHEIGKMLYAMLDQLVAAGVLEKREEPDFQYRWNPAFVRSGGRKRKPHTSR